MRIRSLFGEQYAPGEARPPGYRLISCRWVIPVGVVFLGLAGSPLSALGQGAGKAAPGAVGGPARAAARTGGEERDSYFSIRGPTELSVSLHQVGVLVKHGVPARALANLARSLGLRSQRRLGEFLFVYSLPETLSRRNVASFARTVKVRGPGIVAEAGLVVGPPGSNHPMIATDKFISQFRPNVRRAQVDSMNAANGVRILEANRLSANHYLLEVTEKSRDDVLTMSNRYHRSGLAEYAHPNWIHNLRFREYLPTDAHFQRQWHHRNTGQAVSCTGTAPCPQNLPCPGAGLDCPGTAGTEDADIDTPLAWEISRRVSPPPNVTIAVIDGGYDLEHPDLRTVLWRSSDGSHGYDYFDCDGCRGNACDHCGDANPGWEANPDNTYLDHDAHGTPVAGLVAAADDGAGAVGVCPGAKLLLIRRGFDEEHLAQAFQFAHDHGARIITCSWGFYEKDPQTPTLHKTIEGVVNPTDGSLGSTVLFAMDYAGGSGCERADGFDLAELPYVIAVSGSTNRDTRLGTAACGDYVDVLAPSGSGTLDVATTDVHADSGYNFVQAAVFTGDGPSPYESSGDRDYTFCFGGTSAATPIAAGAAGLLLTVRPDLTPVQVRRLLQDTADRIEPAVAAYEPATGFSRPPASRSTHGFGRVNAFEAVRVAAPPDAGGKDGVDVFLRDNALDWGNTERPSNVSFGTTRGFEPHWESTDIKIDAGPDTQTDPRSTGDPSKSFDALEDEEPATATANRIYVRVRNRGYRDAHDVKVRLYRTYMGTAAPALPPDFWTGFAAKTFTSTEWTFVGESAVTGLLKNSGSTAAKEARDPSAMSPPKDEAAIVQFIDQTIPGADPTKSNHFSFLVIVDSQEDHPSPYAKVLNGQPTSGDDFVVDALAPADNNVTLRNVGYENSSIPGADPIYTRTKVTFSMRNPTPAVSYLYHDVAYPGDWRIWDHSDGFPGGAPPLPPGTSVPAYLVVGARVGSPSEFKAFQFVPNLEGAPFLGAPRSGLTVRFRPGG